MPSTPHIREVREKKTGGIKVLASVACPIRELQGYVNVGCVVLEGRDGGNLGLGAEENTPCYAELREAGMQIRVGLLYWEGVAGAIGVDQGQWHWGQKCDGECFTGAIDWFLMSPLGSICEMG